MTEEILRLTRENNEMLKRICAYIDKIESPQYMEQRQMTSFLINCAADAFGEMRERIGGNNCNDQIFYR